jgi:hypothetical protein
MGAVGKLARWIGNLGKLTFVVHGRIVEVGCVDPLCGNAALVRRTRNYNRVNGAWRRLDRYCIVWRDLGSYSGVGCIVGCGDSANDL